MFEKKFKNVKISTVTAPKRGCCLEAQNLIGEKIHMDFCGMNPMLVPDGTNAYFFANSLILVTRWSDMSDEEKNDVENSEIKIVAQPYPFPQFGICVGGNWGDVFVNLYHCYKRFNNIKAPVDEIILIFSDTHDGDYIISRSVALPDSLRNFFAGINARAYQSFNLDDSIQNIKQQAEADGTRDFCDLLYDITYNKVKGYQREARNANLDDVPNGVYITIGSNNAITNVRTNKKEASEKSEPMSEEVKMYLKLAEKGIAEAQYNLGVCYETGDGVGKNPEKAVFWYNKAAFQGYNKAQYNLGVCLYSGNGIAQNYKKAYEMFNLAAKQGNMYAQFNLAVCYFNGIGTEVDRVTGADWLMKAAAQGHPEAEKAMGIN